MVGILATRAFISLLIASIITLVFYSATIVYTRTIVVPKPSLSTFEVLQDSYADTITCPCSEPATPYGKMMTLEVLRFHQVIYSIKDLSSP